MGTNLVRHLKAQPTYLPFKEYPKKKKGIYNTTFTQEGQKGLETSLRSLPQEHRNPSISHNKIYGGNPRLTHTAKRPLRIY